MTKQIFYPDYYDVLEYHGNTTIVLTRLRNDTTVWRDWILFDSVEEASDYFNTNCYQDQGNRI